MMQVYSTRTKTGTKVNAKMTLLERDAGQARLFSEEDVAHLPLSFINYIYSNTSQ